MVSIIETITMIFVNQHLVLTLYIFLEKLDKHFCSHLFWSPAGQYIVIAEIRDSGALEFVDTADFTTMCSTEHYKATDIEWDPTGRYVATGVSSWKTKVLTQICIIIF